MILFWGDNDEYSFLSNFYPSPFQADGLTWPTVEHYYQAKKSKNKDEWLKMSKLPTPLRAKQMGRKILIRSDWEEVKVEVMLEALRCKFEQNPNLKMKLLSTGTEELHEDSPYDQIWGWRNNGLDLLGKCLMQVRSELA